MRGGGGAAPHKSLAKTRGGVCAGCAFDKVFAESYVKVSITKATPQQQRSFLLAAQQIRANKSDGSVRILAIVSGTKNSPPAQASASLCVLTPALACRLKPALGVLSAVLLA